MADNATTTTAADTSATTTAVATQAPAATNTQAPSTWSSWADVETHPDFGSLPEGVRAFWKSGAEGLSKRAADLEAESQRYLQLVTEANPDLGEYRKRAEAGDKYKSDYEKAASELATLRSELEAAKASGASKAELDSIRAEMDTVKKAHSDEIGTLKTSHAEALNNAFLDTALKYHEVIADAYPQLMKIEKNANGEETFVWSSESAKAVMWQLLTKNGASIENMPSIRSVLKELGALVAQPEQPSKQALAQNGGSGGGLGTSLMTNVEAEAAQIASNPQYDFEKKHEMLSQLAMKHRMTDAQKDDLYAVLYPELRKLKR